MSEESTDATPSAAEEPVHVRTFLIADIRGYTSFTREHGDEAAAELATSFARLTRDGVARFGGSVIELRGDEALAAFTSTRQALRAAVDLQLDYLRFADEHENLPLRAGIGLDAGEAVPVEGGFRGSALNMAARLCSAAGPGEILTTETVAHLAGALSGIEYESRRLTRLKGMNEPVRAMLVTSDELRRHAPALPAPDRRPPAARLPFLDDVGESGWTDIGVQISGLVRDHVDAVNAELKRELGTELEGLAPRPPRSVGRNPWLITAPPAAVDTPRAAPPRWLVAALAIAAILVAILILWAVLH